LREKNEKNRKRDLINLRMWTGLVRGGVFGEFTAHRASKQKGEKKSGLLYLLPPGGTSCEWPSRKKRAIQVPDTERTLFKKGGRSPKSALGGGVYYDPASRFPASTQVDEEKGGGGRAFRRRVLRINMSRNDLIGRQGTTFSLGVETRTNGAGKGKK